MIQLCLYTTSVRRNGTWDSTTLLVTHLDPLWIVSPTLNCSYWRKAYLAWTACHCATENAMERRLALKCKAGAELHVIVCKVCPELQGLPWNAWHCATEHAMDGSTVSTHEPGSAKRWPKVQGLPWNARHCATENAVDIPAVAIISSYQYVWYKRETGEIFLMCSLQLIVNAQTMHIFWQSVHTVYYLPGMTVQPTDATALLDNARQL